MSTHQANRPPNKNKNYHENKMTYIANKSGLLLLSLQYLIFKNAFNYDETKFYKTDK